MRIEGAIAADEPSEAGSISSELCERRRPEGLEVRGHAQRASAAPEHRAAEGESGAKTRNTAQASAQGGAKMRNDHCELRGWQWRGAHEARAQWAKQREVSPISKGGPQASSASAANRPLRIVDSKLSRHPLVKKTFLTSGFFPALAAVTPDRSRRGRCCPRPGGCPAPGRCGGFPPCGRARGSRRPAFPRALRRRSAG